MAEETPEGIAAWMKSVEAEIARLKVDTAAIITAAATNLAAVAAVTATAKGVTSKYAPR